MLFQNKMEDFGLNVPLHWQFDMEMPPTQIFSNLTWGCEGPFFKVSVWVNNILLFLVGKVNSHIWLFTGTSNSTKSFDV